MGEKTNRMVESKNKDTRFNVNDILVTIRLPYLITLIFPGPSPRVLIYMIYV